MDRRLAALTLCATKNSLQVGLAYWLRVSRLSNSIGQKEIMNWNATQLVIALSAPPNGSGGTGQTTAPWYIQFFPFFILIFVFYFILIRPQQKKAKEHQKLLGNLHKGDKIVTGSGIIGTVVAVQDKTISIRSADTKLEVLKSAVSEVIERTNEPSQT
jgi:preprotein translocase subunit YajC